MQLTATFEVIRPCRESTTGWTPEAARLPGNHGSLELSERGPALKVFWSRWWRDGHRAGERTRLPKATRVVLERLTKQTEPEGVEAGAIRSAPFGSKLRLAGASAHQC